ncbi:homocitrate synthase [uncultured Bradyrhizobium sp.]|uniref:homocitrate synthase/isopropylmalate synthase family protein n=1 Tax=uncultured Bradyrhizobium sp. TaxID=199684 RepID=UPI0035C97D74
MIRRDVILEDTTLRDGEQAPGVAFSKATKLKILDKLIATGVKWVEPGIPAMGGEELDTLHAMLERKDEVKLIGWNRGIMEDVAATIDMGFEAIHIGLPTSSIHLKESVGKDRTWLFQRAAELIKYAKDRGVFVSISAEDVGRTEIIFLQEYAIAVSEAGADRLRLSDTIGILSPEEYWRRVEAVAQVSAIDTQCHCHNDFGLAVANTLAGLRAGARYFHVCVNSMGERAGMPDLAQMTLALKHLYGRDLGIRTEHLKELAEMVAQASHQPLPAWQPVVGDNVFAHESGIHVKGMLNDTNTFEPFRPEEVGNVRRYVIGKHSGRATLRSVLEDRGIDVEDDRLARCLTEVRAAAINQGAALSPDQLCDLYKDLSRTAEVVQ